MPGRVKQLIDELCHLRAQGNPGVVYFVRANLLLHGINPEAYDENSPDDASTEESLRDMITGFDRRKVEPS